MKRLIPVLAVATVLALAGCTPGPASPTSSPGAGSGNGTTGSKGAAGCGIVTQSEVSSISGVNFGPGTQVLPTAVTPTKNAPVDLHQDCNYTKGSANVGYFINTLVPAAPAYEAKAYAADHAEDPATTDITVDGFPGINMPVSHFQGVAFYDGQLIVNVSATGVNAGTALAVAKLVASRL